MKTTMREWDMWLRRRLLMYIWKQWKKQREFDEAGSAEKRVWIAARTRKAYWQCAAKLIVQEGLSKEILARAGYCGIRTRASKCTYGIELPCNERYTRGGRVQLLN